MGILDRSRPKVDGATKQAAIGREIATVLVRQATEKGGPFTSRLAANAAVFVAVAQRLDVATDHFNPFFNSLWSELSANVPTREEEWVELIEKAVPILERGLSAVQPAEQNRFGKELASFIDPELDVTLVSVSAPLAIDYGHQFLAAAKLLKELPPPAG